jgi:hypothetical protein
MFDLEVVWLAFSYLNLDILVVTVKTNSQETATLMAVNSCDYNSIKCLQLPKLYYSDKQLYQFFN